MTFSSYLKSRFGGGSQKVYKISLSTGCTCPNRDGTKGTGGCIFCSEGGSGEFGQQGTIKEQLEKGKKLIEAKMGRGKSVPKSRLYIAYFQSFSNTYVTEKMPLEKLEQKFLEAASDSEVVAVSIGTRCDCIDDKIIEMILRLKKETGKPFWIETGLQSCHDETLKKINSQFSLSDFEGAYKKLKSSGIEVIVHLIFGLPGESEEMMEESVKYVCALEPAPDGIKLQNLQILKGTKLAEDFCNGGSGHSGNCCCESGYSESGHSGSGVKIFSLEEWAEFLKKVIPLIPEKPIVQRITGDGPKSLLIEPKWSADKKSSMNYLNKALSGLI